MRNLRALPAVPEGKEDPDAPAPLAGLIGAEEPEDNSVRHSSPRPASPVTLPTPTPTPSPSSEVATLPAINTAVNGHTAAASDASGVAPSAVASSIPESAAESSAPSPSAASLVEVQQPTHGNSLAVVPCSHPAWFNNYLDWLRDGSIKLPTWEHLVRGYEAFETCIGINKDHRSYVSLGTAILYYTHGYFKARRSYHKQTSDRMGVVDWTRPQVR